MALFTAKERVVTKEKDGSGAKIDDALRVSIVAMMKLEFVVDVSSVPIGCCRKGLMTKKLQTSLNLSLLDAAKKA